MANNCFFKPNCLMNFLLFNPCLKFPMWKGHYITGCGIVGFSNLACVENSLNNLSSGCKNVFKQCGIKRK